MIPVLLYIYLAMPAMSANAEKKVELEQEITKYTAMIEEVENLVTTQPRDIIHMAQLRRQIPEAPYIDLIIRDLRLLEVTSGMQMPSYNINVSEVSLLTQKKELANPTAISDQASALVNQVKITTNMTGSYAQIHRMLEEVESMNRIVQVENISFSTETMPMISVNMPDKPIHCSVTFVTFFSPGLKQHFNDQWEPQYELPAQRSNPMY